MKSEWSEVYLCYLEDEIVYIGSGKLNRHKHCNSGTSHVYELNKLHFEGNYACDCNLSDFIRKNNTDFLELDCGDTIVVEDFKITKVRGCLL